MRLLSYALAISIMLLSTRTLRADAVLEGFNSPFRIPDQYIVVLRDDESIGWIAHKTMRHSKSERDAARMANKNRISSLGRELLGNRGALGKTLHVSMKAFSAFMSESSAREIASDPRVERIVAVTRTWEAFTQQEAPWHLDRIDQESWPLNSLYNYSSMGNFPIPNPQRLQKVTLFVVDSGVRRNHVEFNGRASYNIDFVGSASGDQLDDNDPCNGNGSGHGTLVAGLIAGATYGVAKGVAIEPMRITDCQGGGSSTDMVQAIDYITQYAEDFGINGDFPVYIAGVRYYQPILANMSVITAENSAVRTAINASLNAGVIWVTGAGNDKADACQRLPGAISGVINVGATEIGSGLFVGKHDRIWDDTGTPDGSNYGSCVDLFAPGAEVRSSSADSDTDTEVHSGTSLAAPQVAGVAALYLASNPTKSLQRFMKQ